MKIGGDVTQIQLQGDSKVKYFDIFRGTLYFLWIGSNDLFFLSSLIIDLLADSLGGPLGSVIKTERCQSTHFGVNLRQIPY